MNNGYYLNNPELQPGDRGEPQKSKMARFHELRATALEHRAEVYEVQAGKPGHHTGRNLIKARRARKAAAAARRRAEGK